MNWKEVCDDPILQNLPYKIELNRHGEVVMNAVRMEHSFYVERIQFLLKDFLPNGYCPPELAVETEDGVRSPDVAWISRERALASRGALYATVAPEICVEVMSPGNTELQMTEKRRLYFKAGAEEFWLCSEEGKIRFFTPFGELESSKRVPDFPNKIKLFLE